MVSRTTQSYQLLDSSSSIAHHLLTPLVKTRTRGSVSIHCVKHRSIPLYSWRTFVTSATSFLTSWFWGLSRASRQARASGLFSLLMISRMRTRRGGIRLGDMQRLLSRGSVAQMHNVGAATLGTAMKWLGRVCRLWRWRTFMVLHGLRETHRRSVESSPECYPEERAMLYWGCSSRVIFVQGEPRIWRTSKHPLRFCSWEDDNNLLTGRFGDSHYSTLILPYCCSLSVNQNQLKTIGSIGNDHVVWKYVLYHDADSYWWGCIPQLLGLFLWRGCGVCQSLISISAASVENLNLNITEMKVRYNTVARLRA